MEKNIAQLLLLSKYEDKFRLYFKPDCPIPYHTISPILKLTPRFFTRLVFIFIYFDSLLKPKIRIPH